ncbi:MAG: DUF6163 family protein [Mesorhizobium sp.]|nr:DUF6163 family protein [Mesorhizobium sp.]
MSDLAPRRVLLEPSGVEIAFAWFQRVVAGYCLLFGTLYWVRLIGIFPDPLWRFDLMPMHWQVASATLAVFFPFAAAGLWMLTSWGPVIWFICAATETVMYEGFPQLFGERHMLVAAHGLVALAYLAFRVVLHLRCRRAAQEAAG